VAHAVRRARGFAFNVARAIEFHALASGVVEKQAFDLRQYSAKLVHEFLGAGRKAGEGSRDEKLGILPARERLDFAQLAWQHARRGARAKREKSLQQQRRQNRAILYRTERRGIRAKVSDAHPAHAIYAERADFPLRAIAVGPWRRGVRRNFAGPFDATNSPQRLAKDFGFEFELRVVWDVLIIAAATNTEMRASSSRAVGRRFEHTLHPRANEFLFLLDRSSGDALGR